MLALSSPELKEKLKAHKAEMAQKVAEKDMALAAKYMA